MDPKFSSFDPQSISSTLNPLTYPDTGDSQTQRPPPHQQHDQQQSKQQSSSQADPQPEHHQQPESQPRPQTQQHQQPQHVQQLHHQHQQFSHYSAPHQLHPETQPPPYPYLFETHPHHTTTAPQLAHHYPLHHPIHQPPYLAPPHHAPAAVPSDTATPVPVPYPDPSHAHNHPLLVAPDASQFPQQHAPIALPQPYSVTQALSFVPSQHPQQPYHPTRPYPYGQLDYAVYHPQHLLQDRSQTPSQLSSTYTHQHLASPHPPQSLSTSQPFTPSHDADLNHHHQIHAIHSLHPPPPTIDTTTDPTKINLQPHQQLYTQPHCPLTYQQHQFTQHQTSPSTFYIPQQNQIQPSDQQLLSSNQPNSQLPSTVHPSLDHSEIKQQSSDSRQATKHEPRKRSRVQEDDHQQNQVSKSETHPIQSGQHSPTSSRPSPPTVSRPSSSFSSPPLLPTQRPPPRQRKAQKDHIRSQSQFEERENGKLGIGQNEVYRRNGHSKQLHDDDSKKKNGTEDLCNSTCNITSQAPPLVRRGKNTESFVPDKEKSYVASSQNPTDESGLVSRSHVFCPVSLAASLPSDSSRMSPCSTLRPQNASHVQQQNGKHTAIRNDKNSLGLTSPVKIQDEKCDFKGTRDDDWLKIRDQERQNQKHVKDLVDNRSRISSQPVSDVKYPNGKLTTRSSDRQSPVCKDDEAGVENAVIVAPCVDNVQAQRLHGAVIPDKSNKELDSKQQITESTADIKQKKEFASENAEEGSKALRLGQRDDVDVAAVVLGVDLAKDRGGEALRNRTSGEEGLRKGGGRGERGPWVNSKGEKKKKVGTALPVHLRNPKRGRARVFRECRVCHTENHIRRSDCSKCGETLPIGKRRRDGQVTFWWREGGGASSAANEDINANTGTSANARTSTTPSATPSASESVDAGAGEEAGEEAREEARAKDVTQETSNSAGQVKQNARIQSQL